MVLYALAQVIRRFVFGIPALCFPFAENSSLIQDTEDRREAEPV
jgi:hypothetical protein